MSRRGEWTYIGAILAGARGMSCSLSRLASGLTALLLGTAVVACAATGEEPADDVGESDGAIITAREMALVGSYRSTDPNSIVRGFFTKHPTKNYAFEKKVVFTLDIDSSKVPGLCPGSNIPGAICDGERIEGELRATTSTLELKASDPARVAPQVKDLLGKYRYTLGATTLSLTKIGNPAITMTLAKGSYCSFEYDCNMQRADDTCIIQYACNAQHACVVTQQDPSCDPSWRSVQDLGDVGGTWTATGAPSGAFAKLELVPDAAPRSNQSHGTFTGTTTANAVKTGPFSTMPENPAIGFASISLGSGNATPDVMIVQGVHLSPAGKVVEMKVVKLGNVGPVGSSWVYKRTP